MLNEGHLGSFELKARLSLFRPISSYLGSFRLISAD